MEFFFRPFTFLVILGESISLLRHNPAFLIAIAVASLLLHSSLSISLHHLLHSKLQPSFPFTFPNTNSLPTIPAVDDVVADAPAVTLDFSPFSPALHFRQDLAIFLAVELAFVLAFYAVSFFSTIATVVVSAVSYKSRTLSLRPFFAAVSRTCPRLLVTCFYVSALTIGYFAIVFTLTSPLLIYLNFSKISIIITSIVALVFFLYLLVTFTLSLVVSIIEENCYGMEALGKAAALIKGERLHGFFLNICFNALVFGVFEVCRLTTSSHRKGFPSHTVSYIVATNIAFLVKIFMDMAYTVLYFHCKRDHGEEIELYGSLQYSRLPTAMLSDVDDDLP